MAWNEPGGGNKGDKDPWGNRDDQGPPDLDEVFRKIQRRLGSLFGGKGGGGGPIGGGTPSINGGVIAIILLVLVGLWAAAGVYQLDAKERAVVLRFGESTGDLGMPGLHWRAPLIEQVLVVNATEVKSHLHEAEMLTEDENIVKIRLTVQYVIGNSEDYLLRVKDPDISLAHATESALRHVVGGTEMHEVLTEGRALLASEVKARIEIYMNNYRTGISVTQVNIDDTAPPDAVQAAFDDVTKALEDEQRLRNEADAYANQVVPEARGGAQQQLEEAEGYRQRVISMATGEADRFSMLYEQYKLAPEVTRERIYLDTIESVMSQSTKVLIDVEGGNNMLYLPLDKIMGNRQESTVDQSRSSALDDRVSDAARERQRRADNRRERR
jgi:membrane protease subunit HflK